MNAPVPLADWPGLADALDRPFTRIDLRHHRTIYCQPWLQFTSVRGEQLWVTRLGWPFIRDLLPERWYAGQRFQTEGQRLSDSTGSVFRLPLPRFDLVVKFNRLGQRVDLHYGTDTAANFARNDVFSAEFLCPFHEVSTVLELRAGHYGPRDLRIRAKWPLAIFSPPPTVPEWQLDRSASAFDRHAARLTRDQGFYPSERRVALEYTRDYLVLHHWIRGTDAGTLVRQGRLDATAAERLVDRVRAELATKGFRMLDLKASHVILRPTATGDLRHDRTGAALYALVDFELLERLPEYCATIAAGNALPALRDAWVD